LKWIGCIYRIEEKKHIGPQYLLIFPQSLRENHLLKHFAYHLFRILLGSFSIVSPLTPELNPSAQRCLARFFTGDFTS
jgi:hypothetical protein